MIKILFSILLNSCILFIIAFLLAWNEDFWVKDGVLLSCAWKCNYFSLEAWKTYIIGGVILGLINLLIRPILKIITLPFFFLFLGLTIFLVNAVVLKLFDYIINDILLIPWVGYSIPDFIDFIIAVAIFTILNMFYALLFSKK